jgi:hypothetical protein
LCEQACQKAQITASCPACRAQKEWFLAKHGMMLLHCVSAHIIGVAAEGHAVETEIAMGSQLFRARVWDLE